MHLYLIDRIPRGLNVDEVGSAYDAYCLGKFGVDRWRKPWPVYFMNYRDGQNPLYTYLLVPVFLCFGTSVYAIRSVIIVSAFVMAFFGMRLLKEVFDDVDAGLLFLGLFAVAPVFTMTLRFGLESHLLMALSTILLYLLIRAMKYGGGKRFFLFGIFAGVTLYSYALTYLIVPAFLFLSMIYLLVKRKIGLKEILLTAIPFAVLAAPLAAVQIINYFELPETTVGIFTLTKLSKYRTGELTVSGFFIKILKAAFHTVFHDNVSYNSIPRFGNFYYISVPFVAIGLLWSVVRFFRSFSRKRECDAAVFPLLWAGCCYLSAGFMYTTRGYTNITRMNGVLIALAVFLTEGIYVVFGSIRKRFRLKYVFGALLTVTYLVSFILFARYYFGPYDEDAYPYQWLFFEEYDRKAMNYLEDPENGYEKNTVYLPFIYTYYLWSAKANPYDTMLQMNAEDPDPDKIGRYSMTQGHNLNGEYLFYLRGYSGPEIEQFRKWHFTEHEMGNFVLMTDPLGNPPFFGDGYEIADGVQLEKAYLDAVDEEKAILYGWILTGSSMEGKISISLELDKCTIKAEVAEMENANARELSFVFRDLDYEAFYQSKKKLFRITASDKNGREVRSESCEICQRSK